MIKWLRILEQYPLQLLVAAIFFGRRLDKRRTIGRHRLKDGMAVKAAFWIKLLLIGVPMALVYDAGVQSAVSTGTVVGDRAILLLPVLITALAVWLCYDCRPVNALYYTVTACTAQNLVFNAHWIVITRLGIREDGFGSVLIALGIMMLIYVLVYLIFSRRLREWVDYPINQPYVVCLTVFILMSIIFMNLRVTDPAVQYAVYGSYILGDLFCMLMLFSVFYESGLKQKYQIMEQLLHAEQQKQQMTRENIELINRKCHDLKHQIGALRRMGESPERDAYIREIEQAAVFYESSAKTGNKMLDLLLMEKLLYCEKYKIKLSCIAEGEKLAFMDAMDLYSLFGNALDNAIESVVQEKDEKKRIISFRVASHGQMLSIHFENYIAHELMFEDDLPVTTKSDKEYHGFGMMSIRHIVEKYGGTLQISTRDNLFQLNILMSIPTEKM